MKKRFYLFIMMLSFWGMTQSQTIISNSIESASFQDAKWVDDIKAMHTTDTHIATVRVERKHILWDVFDREMNRKHQEHIRKDVEEYYLGVATTGNKIKLFTCEKIKLRSLRHIVCYTFNTLTKTYKREIIFKSDYAPGVKKDFLLTPGRDINFAVSPNQKYIVISADDYDTDHNSYTVHVFDSNTFDIVYQNAFSDQIDKRFDHEKLEINDAGTVYSLGKTFIRGDKDTRNFKANYNYVLSKITKDKSISTIIPSGDKIYRSFEIYEDQNKVFLVGFSRVFDRNNIASISAVAIDKKRMQLLDMSETDIPTEIYYDLYRKGKAKRKIKNKSQLTKMLVEDFLVDSNGNAYLITHRVNQLSSGGGSVSFPSPGPTGGSYMFTGSAGGVEEGQYEHIVVFKFNNKGKLVWGRAINRVKQSFKHKAFLKNDQLHVVLTADCKISPRSDGRAKIKSLILNERCIFDITFDNEGIIKYNTFSLRNTEGKYYDVSDSFYVDGILLVPQASMRNKRYLKFY